MTLFKHFGGTMTTAHAPIYYLLSTREDIDQLLSELPGIMSDSLVVAFDEERDVFPTDLELARIAACARDNQKRLIIETSDRSLYRRALGLGFDESAVATDEPDRSRDDTHSIAYSSSVRAPVNDRHETTASLATYRPRTMEGPPLPEENYPRADSESEHSDETSTYDPGELPTTIIRSTVATHKQATAKEQMPTKTIPGPVRTIGRIPRRQKVRNGPQYAPVYAPPSFEPENGTAAVRPIPKRRAKKRRTAIIAAAVVTPIVIVVLLAALAVYFLPTADIRLVPNEETVASNITYGVNINNASHDIMIDPLQISHTASAESSTEATGERFEADGTAAGEIQITNPHTSDVFVPAGTEMVGTNGVAYYTSVDVDIPAADPFGSRAFGTGTVSVYAGVAGPDGNLSAGGLTGQLGNGLFFTNPSGLQGGTMRSIVVITEEDVKRAVDEVEVELAETAEAAFLSSIPEGFELIPGTLEVGESTLNIDGEAGTDGETVHVSGRKTIRGQVYEPAALHALAREETGRTLANQSGNERILLANSVSISEPTPLSNDTTAFVVNADATVRTVITHEEQQEISNQLVGRSREDAEQYLREHPKVSEFSLELGPNWLPDRMPEISSRITINVSSGEQTTATR